jgi:hypothetical protein
MSGTHAMVDENEAGAHLKLWSRRTCDFSRMRVAVGDWSVLLGDSSPRGVVVAYSRSLVEIVHDGGRRLEMAQVKEWPSLFLNRGYSAFLHTDDVAVEMGGPELLRLTWSHDLAGDAPLPVNLGKLATATVLIYLPRKRQFNGLLTKPRD